MSDNGDKPAKVPVVAGKEIRAIIPQSLDEAYRLAQAFVQGGIAPRGMQRPEQVMIAILCGLEVGLRPLQAVQGIYVTNGRPQLYGDTLVAVVRGSGKCRYIREGIEGEGENLRAWCETLRVGEDEPVRETFSWQQAKKAGLTSKEGPWSQYPARMLKTRARNFCLRDVYADVLRGLGNDLEEPVDVGDVTERSGDRYQTVHPGVEHPAGDEGTHAAEIEPGVPSDEPPDPDAEAPSETKVEDVSYEPKTDAEARASAITGLMSLLTSELKRAKDVQAVEDVWNDLEIESAMTHDEDALAMANTLKERALKRVAK